MRYIVVVNDKERIEAGDKWTLEETTYEIGELLSEYFEVEHVEAGLE